MICDVPSGAARHGEIAEPADGETVLRSSGPALVPPILIATFLAPVLEEIIFRGIAFAGLAARFGTVRAAIVSVALFVLVHAPQKIYYLPGFLDVGLVALAAVWLRLKYRSIRPGILLHILYNGGSMLAVALSQ